MSDNKQQQVKPFTPSEYAGAFVLAFLAVYLLLQSIPAAFFLALTAVVALGFFMADSLASVRTAVWTAVVSGFHWLLDILRWERKVKLRYGELSLGIDIKARRWVHRHINELKGCLIVGVTGAGKTSHVMSIVHFIITYYLDRRSIQLAFIDLKVGAVDFSLYSRLKLLFRPLANTVDEADQLILAVLEEMERRAGLFRMVSGGNYLRVCNNIDRYHELKRKLNLHSAPDLPYLLLFVDEVSEFTRNSKHLKRLVKIAEQGRAFGVYPYICTQYPTNESIPSILRQQLPTRFIFGMAPTALRVAEVYDDVKPDHELGEHECYASLGTTGRSYIALRTDLVPYEELEAMANDRSGDEPTWADYMPLDEEDFDVEEDDLREEWKTKTEDQKRDSLWVWFDSFYNMPTSADFTLKYKASERTHFNQVRPLWIERFGSKDAVNPNATPPNES